MKPAVILACAALAAGIGAAAVLAPADAAPARKAAPARAAPAARDWTRTVAITPEGGYRMGNPNARVKLVEFASLTCPTCARFTNESKGPLAARIRTGRVSYEFRNYVLNGIDVTASLLARCATPANFFRLTETLYATQPQWIGRINGYPQAEKAKWSALPPGEQLVRLADAGGLTQLAAQAGVTPQRGKACLADPAALARLDRMAEAAETLGVHGTPTFFINGARVDGNVWAQIEPLLRKAGG